MLQGSTNEEKANTIGLALLMDYVFERDLGIVTCPDQGKPVIKFTFCLMFIYGCIMTRRDPARRQRRRALAARLLALGAGSTPGTKIGRGWLLGPRGQ